MRNINIKELGKKTTGLTALTYIIDALRTGATFGERRMLEKFGFFPAPGKDNDKIGSHFIQDGGSDIGIVKFHTGGSAPCWAIVDINDEVTIIEGYDFQNKKYDEQETNAFLERFENELKEFGLEVIEDEED